MRNYPKPKFSNRPKHIFQDNSIYFITARTIDGQWFLRPDKYKTILLDTIKIKTKKFGFSLVSYAILQNHYHLLLKIGKADHLPKFIRELNGASAREINKADFAIDRKIWWNYYDHVIRNEDDFYKHLNYIHQNPIKHGLSDTLEYKFTSYNAWLKIKGKTYLDHSFEKYPIVDFLVGGDEF
jgi:putative transposase